jgi:4'-phosphopantetheinyl transferase
MIYDQALDLQADEAHVWTISLKGGDTQTLFPWLDSEERLRGRSYLKEQDRYRFTSARVALRWLLARYCGVLYHDIRIHLSPNGKPLADSNLQIEFNVAHSGEIVALGFSRRAIGIDVEKILDIPDLKQLAREFFTRSEFEAVMNPIGCSIEEAFFRCWTRKEAFLKAIGAGLSRDLNSFSVSLDKNDPTLESSLSASECLNWKLVNLSLPQDYTGTLVTSNSISSVIQRETCLCDIQRSLVTKDTSQ